MTIKDFKKKFPDVKVQQFETVKIESKIAIMKLVEEALSSLGMGLIYYESVGKKIKIFTSDKMKKALDYMVIGAEVKNPDTGKIGKIVSDKFIVCGCYCIRVDFDGITDVYDCEFFV